MKMKKKTLMQKFSVKLMENLILNFGLQKNLKLMIIQPLKSIDIEMKLNLKKLDSQIK